MNKTTNKATDRKVAARVSDRGTARGSTKRLPKTAKDPKVAPRVSASATPAERPESDRNVMKIEGVPEKRERLLADLTTEGLFTNAALMKTFSANIAGEIGITEAVQSLRASLADVNRGDLRAVETMLLGQAAALNAMFAELARRAGANMGQYLDPAEKYMRLALKAQGQCRATLETLAAIKNPPLVFARQANINNGGQQQVNNGAAPAQAANSARAHAGAHTHAKNPSIEPSKLLEAGDVERLDTGAPGAAGAAHQYVETVGALNGAQDDSGQGNRRA